MWISSEAFERLLKDAGKAEGRAQALEIRAAAQEASMDWMKARLTQLEYERAQLIKNYMGITIPVAEFQKPEETFERSSESLLGAAVSYEDVGDEEAKRQGLDWDGQGRLMRHGKLVQE